MLHYIFYSQGAISFMITDNCFILTTVYHTGFSVIKALFDCQQPGEKSDANVRALSTWTLLRAQAFGLRD